MPSSAATLSIVATPIGNLDDMSPRAREVLAAADVIAAEDTRHSRRLTSHLGIATPLISLHEHNERARIERILARLAAGERVALISDAGTPLISDPGYALVAAVRGEGYAVLAVPGPCAAIAALSIAGLPTDRFVFEGFLPSKAGARRARLDALAGEPRTLVCYESSHRIAATAADLAARLGARRLVLARELTKLHEQSVALSADALPAWLAADDNRRRGEFVLVIDGAPEREEASMQEISLDALLAELVPLAGTKKAAAIAARLTGTARNAAYRRAIELDE
ncbi:16S rRNA (cytidine(1402)-2'-O)-methyltransferase [Salinisphaera sp.]|uniref:16S rRNA (cytidine(1402)-2'-O)-methyltransferase n=1 Tax=Salinisphaera sp. TaxID=1914330 RepID=UPI002D772096|nr:16S rRNA (cytidine(1402)-2'-O)-methyltransferase [Salinisphaera sp.]HET7315142.1 16S rRNA (cytidine(1402)-2'-O)-methyltransferase [Salinisphaera sp.]